MTYSLSDRIDHYGDPDPDDGRPDYRELSNAWHTAKVPHTCDICRHAIQPGEKYQRIVMMHDGEFTVHKQHPGGGCWWRPDPRPEAVPAGPPPCPFCGDDVTERAELSGAHPYAGAAGLRCPACGAEWLPF